MPREPILRYAPDRPFPPYAYLPGRDPHPTRDAKGHSFDASEPRPVYLTAGAWRENEDYLFGIDLYNAGYLWEAHEAWERIWHPARHDALQADFLQGLIQCAAACLKIPMQQPSGLERLTRAAMQRLERVAESAGPAYMGLDLAQFTESFQTFASSSPSSAEERPPMILLL